MAQILVRNLDNDVVARLKSRAAQHNRSLQAEVKTILELAAQMDMHTAHDLAARIRRQLGRKFSDSSALIREDRDR